MADLMRYCSYDLRPVLRNLFLSEEFYSAKAMGSHIKGPAELAVGAIRDLGIKDVNYATVDAAINQMGQYLFEPPNVAGWNEGRTWINAERILVRYNQMAKILEQPNVDLVALLKATDWTRLRRSSTELAKACLVVQPEPATTKALADYLGELPPAAEWDAKRDQINAKLEGDSRPSHEHTGIATGIKKKRTLQNQSILLETRRRNTMSNLNTNTRRDFMTRGLGLVGVGAALPNFLVRTALAGPKAQPDQRVTVILQLAGGHDALSALVPYGDEEYAKARVETRIKDE